MVGGLLVYSLFISSAATAGAKALVSVETVQVIVPTGSTSGVFTITVKNTGNRPVTTLAVTLNAVSQTPTTSPVISFLVGGTPLSSTNPLAPGLATSASGTPTTTGATTGAAMSFTIGNSYSYTVTATFSDGSSFAVSGTVPASSS